MKTLKDFECCCDDEYSCCSDRKTGELPHGISVNELQDAARDWINEMETLLRKWETTKKIHPKYPEIKLREQKHAEDYEYCIYQDYEQTDLTGCITWIKHFFDLED